MDDSFDKILTLVLILNGLAYLIKYILKKKGYPVRWFNKHLSDLPNLWRLIRKTEKTGERFIYVSLGTGFLFLLVVFLFSAFSQMKDFTRMGSCDYEEQFRQTAWSGIVTNKYTDKATPSYKAIDIERDGRTQRIRNWVLFQNGNFEQIAIGDSIVKRKGLVNVSLYKPDEEIELIVDYGCDEANNSNR